MAEDSFRRVAMKMKTIQQNIFHHSQYSVVIIDHTGRTGCCGARWCLWFGGDDDEL